MGSIDQDDIVQILEIVGQSGIEEFRLELGDLKLVLRKSSSKSVGSRAEVVPDDLAKTASSEQPPAFPEDQPADVGETLTDLSKKTEEPKPHESMEESGYTPIIAPLLGTFYRAPKPGAPPFVKKDQFVSEDETLCIIEVMKLFNTVKAGVRGYIRKICAEDGQLVEFNQPLFMVKEVEGEEIQEEVRN